jgi:hypothetical protein
MVYNGRFVWYQVLMRITTKMNVCWDVTMGREIKA